MASKGRLAGWTGLLLLAAGCTNSAATTASDGLVSVGAGLRGPAGMVATVVTTGVPNVAALATDRHDRLWLATAAFSDSGEDGVYLVEAAGAVPRKVIADLHTPLGLRWLDDTLFVSSAERVDAYAGFDGTTFADHRTVLTLPAGVGESNGIALGPDGRIRLGISAPCDHCVPASEYSGAVVSFLPDGTDPRVEAAGIRAPVGLTYDPPSGELLVTMNQRDDLGEQTPGDLLAVVESGQSWGFPDCYGQGGSACADVPQPVAQLDPHAAVSGVAVLGRAALVAEWSYGKVQRVALESAGSTTRGSVSPFLTGLQKPVPVLSTGAAVLVGDWATGTVYSVTPEETARQ